MIWLVHHRPAAPHTFRSAPFNIADIGRTHLALHRGVGRGSKTYLIRIETHILGSSVFMYISRETEPWPLRLRNDTSTRFTFQQVVPHTCRGEQEDS